MARSTTKSVVYKIKLQKGDTVIVRRGKHKGQTGKVLSTQPKENTVMVEGINIVKRHVKPNKEHPQGGIVEELKPILVSKVAIIDPATKASKVKKPARIGYKIDAKGNKVRIARPSGKEITS